MALGLFSSESESRAVGLNPVLDIGKCLTLTDGTITIRFTRRPQVALSSLARDRRVKNDCGFFKPYLISLFAASSSVICLFGMSAAGVCLWFFVAAIKVACFFV